MACSIEDRGCKGSDTGDTLTVTGCPPNCTHMFKFSVELMRIKGLIVVKMSYACCYQGFSFHPGQPGKEHFACCSAMQGEWRPEVSERAQVMRAAEHLNDHTC